MATLSGQQIANRFSSLLKTSSDSTLTSSLTVVEDGAGNDSDLHIATGKVKVATTLGIGVDPSVGKLHINAGSAQALTIDNGNASFIIGKGTQYSFCIGDCNPVSTVGGGTSSTAAQANSNYIASNTGANSSAGEIVIMNGSATGAIGIGKAAPSSGYIDIGTGAATNHQIRVNAPPEVRGFEVYSNAETLLSVDGANKRVGIGENVTAPSYTLDVRETGSATSNLNIFSLTNKANAASMIDTGTSILFNQFYYDAGSPASATASSIRMGTETNWTSAASTQDSYMAFFTKDGSVHGHPQEKVRITSAGNVGIGTAAPTEKLDVTGNVHISGTLTAGNVVNETFNTRYELSDYFEQKPGINDDIQNASEAHRMIVSKNFEIDGVGPATSSLCTFDTARSGILLTTDTTDDDMTLIKPHQDANQTAWANVTWGTDNQVQWECAVTPHDTEANAKNNVRYVAGLCQSATILTGAQGHSQYTDQVLFYYDSDNSASTDMLRYQESTTTWHCVYSNDGTDYVTNLGVTLTHGTTYKLKIVIDSNRKPAVYINDVQYGLTVISGVGDTGINTNGAVSLSSGSSHVITTTSDATSQLVVGDVITNATGVAWGTVTAVTSATSITITAASTKSFPDASDIYVYGRAAASSSTVGAALKDTTDLVPQISVTTRTTAAKTLTVHYQKISRNLI